MSNQKPKIFCLGVSHNSADMKFRESLYVNEQTLEKSLTEIKNAFHFKELAVLSTCNRFEMFGVLDRQCDGSHVSYDAFIQLQKLSKKEFSFTIDEIQQNSFYLEEKEAIEHLFTVVSSIDSVVLGETQITGQFKDSTEIARKAQTLGPTLDRLSQEALAVTKKIRSQTAIGEKTVSISHAAIDLAKKVFGDLSKHNFLIIGAGEMAELAAKYATKYKPKNLMIINRTLSNAQKLVETLGYGEAYNISELAEIIPEADIIISSTSASGYIISKSMLQSCLKKRKKNHPLFIADIALPRDIDPSCSDIEDLYLFEIDDLKQVVDKNIDERKKAAHKGLEMISQHTTQFISWLDSHSIKPTISKYKNYLDELFLQESQKTLSKQVFSNLNESQHKALADMAESIRNKLIGDISRSLKNKTEEVEKFQIAQLLESIILKDNKD